MIAKGIAVKIFAEFVAGSNNRKKSLLKSYKFPNKEGKAIVMYYGPAKAAIATFHKEGHNLSYLTEKVTEFEKHSLNPNKSYRHKMLNNAKAIRNYLKHFETLELQLGHSGKFSFLLGDVRINVTPDLHGIDQSGKEIFVKLNFSEKSMKHEYVRTLINCMSYGIQSSLQKNPDSIFFFDVPSGNVFRGVTVTDALVLELLAHSERLQAVWDEL